jgi:hypothetical protein
MGYLNIIDKINCKFFCIFKKKNEVEKLYNYSKQCKINIIPTPENLSIENLYPKKNNVVTWNTFIISKDKKYILSNVGNKKCASALNINSDQVVDTFGESKFPSEFFKFLDHVWNVVLKKEQVQLYIVMNGTTYLINAYPINNKKGNCIGGILFMRDFDNISLDIEEC